MKEKRRIAVEHALKYCGKEGGCDQCPYLGGPCDMPFVEVIRLPVHVLEDIRAELYEPDSPWMNGPDEEVLQ